MRGQFRLKMKATLRTVLSLTCIALVLFGEMSCGRLGGGIALQDGDCIPPQEMVSLKLIMAANWRMSFPVFASHSLRSCDMCPVTTILLSPLNDSERT